MKRPKKKRSLGRGGYLAGVSLLALALVILFNLIVGQLPSNWLEFDLTDNGLTRSPTPPGNSYPPWTRMWRSWCWPRRAPPTPASPNS